MVPRLASLVLLGGCIPCLSACGTPEVLLSISTDPTGAKVYLSRRGEKAYEGGIGPVKGDMRAEPIVEEFVLLGNAPVEYASPLVEREGGAAVLGIGVSVVRRYEDGVVRVEKDGFDTVERKIRFQDGVVKVDVKLEAAPPAVERSLTAER